MLFLNSSEAPKNPYFVETRNEVPLKSDFKPAVKVLSRKPAPTVIARTDPASGLEQLTLEDDEDEDDESQQKTMSMEERQAKAQKEREEKQKKYEEARQRLFGNSEPASGTTSPRSSGSPAPRGTGDRGRGRGRGNKENRPSSSSGSKTKQLFDPNYTAKPDSIYIQKRDSEVSVSGTSTPGEEQIIRAPRGPDGSGRGGFGFAPRGSRGS